MLQKDEAKRIEKMLKQDATWHEIKVAWDALTEAQKEATAVKFNALLKEYDPQAWVKLVNGKLLSYM